MNLFFWYGLGFVLFFWSLVCFKVKSIKGVYVINLTYQVVYLVSSFNKLGFTLKLIGDIYTREQLYIYAAQLLEFYEY